MPVLPNNDDSCGWIKLLPHRLSNPSFKGKKRVKWLIIGAGNSGLTAAITLGENIADEKIILIDANKAGEGASARNSGFLMASTLNDGHLSGNGLEAYKSKFEINNRSTEIVRQYIDKYKIDCALNECGKYHASVRMNDRKKLLDYNKILDKVGIENEFIEGAALKDKLGIDFYKMAIKTKEGALLQPAAYSRGLINALPENVELFENSPVLKIDNGKLHKVFLNDGEIIADNIIIAVNGFMPSLGIKKDRVFPLLLTASITRPLTNDEQCQMNGVDEWGLVSANPMGATVRYLPDNRLMIRNTVEISSKLNMSKKELSQRRKIHQIGLDRRFPFLTEKIIEHSWSGITCISSNNANIFEQLSDNHWVIGCYNGAGLGLSSLFGQEIALRALDKASSMSKIIAARPKAKWLPPQPFLNWGVKIKLATDRLKAKDEN